MSGFYIVFYKKHYDPIEKNHGNIWQNWHENAHLPSYPQVIHRLCVKLGGNSPICPNIGKLSTTLRSPVDKSQILIKKHIKLMSMYIHI